MAKMYYNSEEAQAKLGCNEDQLKGLVRNGKLREFRDAGKLNYKVEDVDKLVAEQSNLLSASGSSGELSLEDSGEISLMPDDSGSAAGLQLEDSSAGTKTPPPAKSGPKPSRGGSDAPIDLSGSSGELKLEESGEIPLSPEPEKPKPAPKPTRSGSTGGGLSLEESGFGDLKLEDSRAGGRDQISLDEVDNDRLSGIKKDDTVITNIGISVFDDEDLQIAADPMAKTLLTGGGEDHLGLDGSAGGSGLLDLTRESDDTSLGAELLEGIDMGDTAETIAPTQTAEAVEPMSPAGGDMMAEPSMEPVLPMGGIGGGGPRAMAVHYVEAASPVFTGLLVAAAVALTVLGMMVVATTMGAWPKYLNLLSDNFWIGLGVMLGLGAVGAGVGFLAGMKPSGPRAPKKPKEPKPKKEKKGKKGKAEPGIPEAE